MNQCIFCQIVHQDIPAELLYEDDLVVAFRDVRPIAPVHILIIPRQHIESVVDLAEAQEVLAGRLIMAAKKLAKTLGLSEKGYKLLIRVKEHGGQEIDHLHLHLIGGAKLTENIRPV